MLYIARIIATILIPAIMQLSLVNFVSVDPNTAVTDFMDGLKTNNETVMKKHMDNEYVNFLVNVEGDDKVVQRMNDAIFENFTYKIEKIGTGEDVAVAKISIKNSDFSKVDSKYKKKAYKYIMDNLYSDKIADKKALNAKCLEIYVKQIEKAAKKGVKHEEIIYVPMVDNGYYGWNIVVTDELMKSIMGDFEIFKK